MTFINWDKPLEVNYPDSACWMPVLRDEDWHPVSVVCGHAVIPDSPDPAGRYLVGRNDGKLFGNGTRYVYIYSWGFWRGLVRNRGAHDNG